MAATHIDLRHSGNFETGGGPQAPSCTPPAVYRLSASSFAVLHHPEAAADIPSSGSGLRSAAQQNWQAPSAPCTPLSPVLQAKASSSTSAPAACGQSAPAPPG